MFNVFKEILRGETSEPYKVKIFQADTMDKCMEFLQSVRERQEVLSKKNHVNCRFISMVVGYGFRMVYPTRFNPYSQAKFYVGK